ncbi:hypothetical protein DU43_14415 [Methanosarcina mazei]|uniref:Uncharacterized protein n=1 Tax=Methanosarcina mazei TaxID=2209 RepID=A0A0F8HGL4_METMZ|nr:hypothetical protein [Methanosarcina mazei]KKG76847.1 hypothetical protein DU43_14415 [Methanosarcina mazei]
MGRDAKTLENRQQMLRAKYEKKEKRLEKELEKRERLIQTYFIVFGLFLAYDKVPSLQINSMKSFLFFMFCALTYYTLITKYTYYMRSRPEKLLFFFINVSAFGSAVFFSRTVVDYMYMVGTDGTGFPLPKIVVTCLLVIITWFPLYFSSDLQIQFPETLMLEENRIIVNDYVSKTRNIINLIVYGILTISFSILAHTIIFAVITTTDGSSNLNVFELIVLPLALVLNLLLFSKIISIRSNWSTITFSMPYKRIEFFKYDQVIPWKRILKKSFLYVTISTFFIAFFTNITSIEIYMIYMQYKSQSFTDQQITVIYIIYTLIGSVLHFEIFFAMFSQIVNILRSGNLLDRY